MPNIAVPNTVMVEMVFVQFNQRMENVYHVRCAGPPTMQDLINIRGVFELWDKNTPQVTGNLVTMRATTCALVNIKCTSLHGTNDIFHEYILPVSSAGASAGYGMTYSTIAIKWNTNNAGRSFRGRTYHIGNVAVPGSDGLISQVSQGQLQTCYNLLLTRITAAGYTLVVASKYSGVQMVNGYRRGIPRAVGITTPIVSCGVERTFDTMRKRKIPHIV